MDLFALTHMYDVDDVVKGGTMVGNQSEGGIEMMSHLVT